MTGKANPSIEDPRLIDPGDVLFFAPPVEAGDFDDFAQLAACAQGYPWHHVAIAGSRHNDVPQVIGFSFERGDVPATETWLAPLREVKWADATKDSAITALRPPAEFAKEIRKRAEAHRDAQLAYDLDGLLAFAAATNARMFAEGETRTKAMQFAAGVEEARRRSIRPLGYTCVSAVAIALDEAGVDLTLRELPPHFVPDDKAGAKLAEITRVIEQFLGKARATTPFGALDAGSGPLSLGEIQDGWGLTFGKEDPGGLVKSTAEYLRVIKEVADGFRGRGYSSDRLIELGRGVPADETAPHCWRTSPAMLHAALMNAGFTPVP